MSGARTKEEGIEKFLAKVSQHSFERGKDIEAARNFAQAIREIRKLTAPGSLQNRSILGSISNFMSGLKSSKDRKELETFLSKECGISISPQGGASFNPSLPSVTEIKTPSQPAARQAPPPPPPGPPTHRLPPPPRQGATPQSSTEKKSVVDLVQDEVQKRVSSNSFTAADKITAQTLLKTISELQKQLAGNPKANVRSEIAKQFLAAVEKFIGTLKDPATRKDLVAFLNKNCRISVSPEGAATFTPSPPAGPQVNVSVAASQPVRTAQPTSAVINLKNLSRPTQPSPPPGPPPQSALAQPQRQAAPPHHESTSQVTSAMARDPKKALRTQVATLHGGEKTATPTQISRAAPAEPKSITPQPDRREIEVITPKTATFHRSGRR